ncbi:MAG: carbamoyltransferase [Byssovorax sp.]
MPTPSRRAILGISAFYHDSAAALVVDGEIVAAAQEERFTRIRHDHEFPKKAIDYCLAEAKMQPEDVSYVVFYDKPIKKFDRILETYFAYAPSGFWSFKKALPLWLKEKLHVPRGIRRGLQNRYNGKLVFTDHHQSHAASAFFPSPYDEAAILCADGVGEWATTTWGVGKGNQIHLKGAVSFPHSLGLLYSAFTYFTGFKVNSGEYKMMGLAPYGDPTYVDVIKKHLIDIKPDGSYRMAMEYFNYCDGLTMTGDKFAELFGGPARKAEAEITKREMDLAASIQVVTEDIMMLTAQHIHKQTGMKNLVLAGGVALNCVANGKLVREGPFENIWIQPAAGDAGGALGAALFVWYQLLENKRVTNGKDSQKGSYLGPAYSDAETRAFFDSKKCKYHHFDKEQDLLDLVAKKMDEGKVIGWSYGRMEFGPRALGARSIIGDPRNVKMQSTMNLKIKYRESFRPFAPCVLKERAHEIFVMDEKTESPYMLLVAPVREKYRKQLTDEEQKAMKDPDLRKRVNVPRSDFPAITHVDYSARIQTVDEERHGRYYRLMKTFEKLTGCPVIVNTSFNVRGEPIVNTPAEAYNCFLHTEMDVLVVGDCVLLKEEQPKLAESEQKQYLSQFSLD